MKAQRRGDWYAAYWWASFGATTATGRSELLEGEISHAQVTRYLAGPQKTASALWRTVNSLVRDVQAEVGGLRIDDSIAEKPYTDENARVGWHYDHAKDRRRKGSNFLTARYSSQGVSVPVGFPLVAKTEQYLDPKTQKEKRWSAVSKPTVGQALSKHAVRHRLPFRFVLFEGWFASAETRVFIKHPQHRDFICPLNTTRQGALRQADKQQGRSGRVDTLEREAQATREIHLAGVACPLVRVKPVFTHEAGSVGLRYLVSRATPLSFDAVTTTDHTRGGVAWYPKSLKQHVSFAQSPTQPGPTPTHHFFAAWCGLIKLEQWKMRTQLNPFALQSKLSLNALHAAFATLRALSPVQGSA